MSTQKINLRGQVINIGYNILAVLINDMSKVVFVHKFPPVPNTTHKPDLSVPSDIDKYRCNPRLTKDSVCKFWADKGLYQVNGDWKGGEWGSNNLPTTDTTWCTGVFIRDEIDIVLVKEGIVPYMTRKSKPFDITDEIVEGSENFVWSCNLELTNSDSTKSSIQYSGYVCDKPMSQSAIDILFVWKNLNPKKLSMRKLKRYVKILKRGRSHPNVDMPELFMPGAGEHREPGNNISFKSEVLRALREELGLPDLTIFDCYLISIGSFDNDKRDPRYWTFTIEQDGEIITFGLERYSKTEVYVMYIETDNGEKPKESKPLDEIEVGEKKWVSLDDPSLLSNSVFMIPEHSTYFSHCSRVLDNFDELPIEHKINKKFLLS